MSIKIAITLGDPGGIGPDICVLMAEKYIKKYHVVITYPQLLIDSSKNLNRKIRINILKSLADTPKSGNHLINVLPIKLNKKYKSPSKEETKALLALVNALENVNDKMSPEDIQTLIYSVGKENGYTENLREWFKLIYEVVFGDENGPRMGFFISFFGVDETKQLIKDKLK